MQRSTSDLHTSFGQTLHSDFIHYSRNVHWGALDINVLADDLALDVLLVERGNFTISDPHCHFALFCKADCDLQRKGGEML